MWLLFFFLRSVITISLDKFLNRSLLRNFRFVLQKEYVFIQIQDWEIQWVKWFHAFEAEDKSDSGLAEMWGGVEKLLVELTAAQKAEAMKRAHTAIPSNLADEILREVANETNVAGF